jgi:hypothetical protein
MTAPPLACTDGLVGLIHRHGGRAADRADFLGVADGLHAVTDVRGGRRAGVELAFRVDRHRAGVCVSVAGQVGVAQAVVGARVAGGRGGDDGRTAGPADVDHGVGADIAVGVLNGFCTSSEPDCTCAE